jgi:hypothetical protein
MAAPSAPSAPSAASVRGPVSPWAAWAFVGLGALASAAYLATPTTAAGAFIYAAIGVASAGAVGLGLKLNRPSVRLPWVLFMVSLLLAVAGNSIRYVTIQLPHASLFQIVLPDLVTAP